MKKIQKEAEKLSCPKCVKGKLLKGKGAFGCSEWKSGCNFRISFQDLAQRFQTQDITKEILSQWKN